MKLHKYRVGQTVQFQPSFTFGTVTPSGPFTVEQLLPPDSSDNQYRVTNTVDGHRRVVRESELSLS